MVPLVSQLCLRGRDIGCTCNRGGTGLLPWSAAPCTPRRRVSCHLSSQRGQRRAAPREFYNLLKEKPKEQTLPAGTAFALV